MTGSSGMTGMTGMTGNTGTSITDVKEASNLVIVFPNPASYTINFKCPEEASQIDIYDLTGRLAGSYLVTNETMTISTASFEPGTYFYTVLNNKKACISKGKILIIK